MQEELRLAYEIQNNLLPNEPPRLAGYDIAGKSIPAKEVGGDYFDFLAVGENNLAFCLGDVSGKGLPAALLMANLQATVRGQAMAGDLADLLPGARQLAALPQHQPGKIRHPVLRLPGHGRPCPPLLQRRPQPSVPDRKRN